jgi:hypothetical protein
MAFFFLVLGIRNWIRHELRHRYSDDRPLAAGRGGGRGGWRGTRIYAWGTGGRGGGVFQHLQHPGVAGANDTNQLQFGGREWRNSGLVSSTTRVLELQEIKLLRNLC